MDHNAALTAPVYGAVITEVPNVHPAFRTVNRMISLMEQRMGSDYVPGERRFECHTGGSREPFYKLHVPLAHGLHLVVTTNLTDGMVVHWLPYRLEPTMRSVVVYKPAIQEPDPACNTWAALSLKLCKLQCLATNLKDIARQQGFTFVYDPGCMRAFATEPVMLEMSIHYKDTDGFHLHTRPWDALPVPI